ELTYLSNYYNLGFYTGDAATPSAANLRMFVSQAGGVGIGTNSPTAFKLQVAGNVGPSSTNAYDLGSSSYYWRKLYANNVSSTAVDALNYVSSTKFIAGSGTNSNPAYGFSAQSGTGLYYAASTLNFSISNTVRLGVSASGALA
ncbi:MAG: hypothetical protein PHW33_03495, partial [Candidatus Portnoybacteria bacterium]|nr:hypothetical protein [Candidatus Portnoybacteria bacterium]